MPEIGNMLFDSCTGGFEVPRGDGYEDVFSRLFDAVAPGRDQSWRDYGPSFENETFQIWPYSWCDCDCGYEEKEYEWSESHKHAPSCYQSLHRDAMREWDRVNDYERIDKLSRCDIHNEEEVTDGELSGTMHSWERSPEAESYFEQWRQLHDKRTKYETEAYRSLCKQLSIPWKNGWGCACHCTCEYDAQWSEFIKDNQHDPRCKVARKSFLYKPEHFWVDWYKYPLRDAHASEPLTLARLNAVVDLCIESLKTDRGGEVVTLEQEREMRKQ